MMQIKKIMLLFVSCIVALGMGELLARIFLPPPQTVIIKKSNNFENRLKNENQNYVDNMRLKTPEQGNLYIRTDTGKRLRANASYIVENHWVSGCRIEISTNSLGYRNPEIKDKKGDRYLFLGDSITLGDYLPEEETFVRLVEGIAVRHGKNWETINAGVGAVSFKNELAILKETGLSVKPDAVIVGFYLNDFQDSRGVYITKLPFPFNKSWLIYNITKHWMCSKARYKYRKSIKNWEKDIKDRLPVSLGDYRVSKKAFNALILKDFQDWGGAWSPYAWEYMKPLFEELKNLALTYDFKVFVIAFPVDFQVKAEFVYDYPQQQLIGICNEFDIPVLDILPVLREEYRNTDEIIFYDLCHHTAYGNRIIANKIFNFLEEYSN